MSADDRPAPPPLDELRERLADLERVPLEARPELFEQVHARLAEELAEIEEI